MSQFISKLQHNTYEKGEFSDEKERTLNETIEFIKNFPWNGERALTDIQLTGPSVTIQDENINYLKLGLYFNGKFCLYYLDNDNHLYEYHAPEIDSACALVVDFFNRQLDLQIFDRHFFNIGNKGHFLTNHFEYRERFWRILMINGLLLFYGVFFLIADVTMFVKNTPIFIGLVIIIFSVIYYLLLAKIFYKAIVNRNNYLQISKGNDFFSFGYNEQAIKAYKKSEISEVVHYISRGSKNPNLIEVYEINFKDGSTIKFSNMLIPSSAFYSKFTDKMGNSYMQIINGKKSPLKML
ncbi:MAG: hypothetical protein JWR67_989 [Mucilaginibacter sp.]|nr:hypothetical protein [Mucilaginibacter sp.]MDB5109875.1 hypothetical protein [Mucilaginibacter sp.]